MHRLLRVLRRDGVGATARRVAGLVARDEAHIWYELDLDAERPHRPLPEGLTLGRALPQEAGMLEELTSLAATTTRRRLDAGAELWLVRDAELPAFACWIFRVRTPVYAAPGGILGLPPDVVCLEDSVTAPSHRGRGIAPAAWDAVASAARAEGARRMITKVSIDNVASRRAVEKAGFVEAATMEMHLRVRRKRITVDGESELARHLARELSAYPPP